MKRMEFSETFVTSFNLIPALVFFTQKVDFVRRQLQ